MKKAVFNWSGGKDSSLSLYRLLKTKEYDIKYLLTSVNSQFQRISMHGVRIALLEEQAKSIGIPLYQLMIPEMPSMEIYDQMMAETLRKFKDEGIDYSIYGDIFLEDLKKYREEQLAKVDMKGVFPIWKESTSQLIRDFIDSGFKAVLVCVNEKYLDKSFAGRLIDKNFLKALPKNVDPCGENGEYHSFVYNGPIFKRPIKFIKGKVVYRNYKPLKNAPASHKDGLSCPSLQDVDTGFWYCDLIPHSRLQKPSR